MQVHLSSGGPHRFLVQAVTPGVHSLIPPQTKAFPVCHSIPSSPTPWASLTLADVHLSVCVGVGVGVFSRVRLFVTLSPTPPTLHPGVQPARLLSVLGILQARILEWAAIPCSRGSSPPADLTVSPALIVRFFTTAPPGPLFYSASVQGACECRDGAETWHLDERRRVILCQIPEAHL